MVVYFSLHFCSLGNGGNAGNVNIRYRMLTGQVKLKSCRGTGAQPAENGLGGEGEKVQYFFHGSLPLSNRFSNV